MPKRTKPIEKTTELKEFFTEVPKLPETKRETTSKYLDIIKSIATLKKGIYKINLNKIKPGLRMKSVYPSLDRALEELAKEKNINIDKFKGNKKRKIEAEYIALRVRGQDIFVEKIIEEPI